MIRNPIRLFAVLCVTSDAFGKLAAAISGLLLASCPSNIARSVVAVIVDALNRVSRGWSRAEIAQEIIKTLELIRNLNTATAVAGEVWDIRISASAFHGRPHIILRRPAAPRSLTMAGSVRSLDLQASAASGVPAPELVHGHRGTAPTRAFANPLRAQGPVGPAESPKTAELLTGKIKPFHRENIRWCDLTMQAGMAI